MSAERNPVVRDVCLRAQPGITAPPLVTPERSGLRSWGVVDRPLRGEAGDPPSARQCAGGDEWRAGPPGEPGVGKSVLLDYAVGCAAALQIVRMVAVELLF